MDIRHLEYFLEVVRQGSFSKAAETLHITQPTISKMIKTLEDELGLTLIYRNAKQAEPTDAGKALLEEALQIVSLFHSITHKLDDVVHLKKGKIRIGMPPIAGSTVFPRILGRFSQAYPGISIELVESGSKKIEQEVQKGSLDVGVVCTLPGRPETFEVFSLLEDPLMVIVHPRHRLTSFSRVSFAMLTGESFVLYRSDFSLYDHIIDHCRQAGFYPKIICETSQREFMTQMVAADLGIALLPGSICAELDPEAFAAIPLAEPQICLQLSVIWKKDRYLPFAARRWLDFAIEDLKRPPA